MSDDGAVLLPGDLDAALASLEAGSDYKSALEALLLALPLERAERLMQLLKEGRGAWLPLLRARGGEALLLGHPLSGTAVALARCGFRITSLDARSGREQPGRARLGAARDAALAGGRGRFLAVEKGAPLPFPDRAFDLVVLETGRFGRAGPLDAALAEARRVCGGELVLTADNRLGYKRSSGRRADFRVPRPLEYGLGVLRPVAGRRTLSGYRAALRAEGFDPPRAFSLYPHSLDFSQVAAIDGPGPRLQLGPMERRNRLKMLGYRAGLFGLLTPSFALASARTGAELPASIRLDDVLDELAARTGEPRPAAEHLVATRGNSAVIHTAVPGAPAEDPAGRWTLHVPLSPQQEVQMRRHHAVIGDLRRTRPELPVPEPLHLGEVAGLVLGCERRLGGLTAPQLCDRLECMRRLYAETARHLATLVVEPAVLLDDARFEALVGAKLDLVARFAAVPSTVAALERMRAEARERLLGLRIPLVVYHADLRAKHVQVAEDGRVLGYLDWGSSEDADLPGFDLLHLIVHDRKQQEGLTAGEAWRLARGGRGLRDFERAALDDYAGRLALPEIWMRAIEDLYPVLVGAMAEANWDYSRPRWVHRNFGI